MPDLAPFIERARSARDTATQVAGEMLDEYRGADLPLAVETEVELRLREADEADQRLRWLTRVSEARSVKVVSEPLVYGWRAGEARHSWFADLALAGRDIEAAGRLERHQREMEVERRAVPVERRAGPNSTATSAFTPPIWMNEYWASIARPERVLAGLVNVFDLPDGTGQSVSLFRVTAGTSAGPLANAQPVGDTDVTDAAVTAPVVQVGGQEDVAIQLLEQSPATAAFDAVMAADLAAAHDAELETLLVSGSGTGGQPLGLLNVPGIATVTYTSASPTGAAMYPYLGQAFAAVSNNRKKAPRCWLATGSRWAWLSSAEDSQTRPFVVPGPPMPLLAEGPQPVGSLFGRPVFVDDALPVAGGADEILAICPEDMILWAGQPKFRVLNEILSGVLGVRCQVYSSVAAALGRYPTGTAVVSGTGMTVQSGF